MSRRTSVILPAALIGIVAFSIGTEAFAQRLNGACRGIERRGFLGRPTTSRVNARYPNLPSGYYRRGVPVFRTTVSGYYYGGRTTRNKFLRGDYYCGRPLFYGLGIYGGIRPAAVSAKRVRKARSVFTSTPAIPNRITYGDKYGWNKLAENKPAEAMKVFLQQARRQPNYGMPKVGYAIAAAANGELSEGVKILRHAIEKHPRTLKRMSLDAKARSALKTLAAQYRAQKQSGDTDAAYLLATLVKLQPQPPAAKQTAGIGELRIIPR